MYDNISEERAWRLYYNQEELIELSAEELDEQEFLESLLFNGFHR